MSEPTDGLREVATVLYPGLFPNDAIAWHPAQIERVAAWVERRARERATAVLRAAAQEQRNEAANVPDIDEGTHADGHHCAADFIDRRANLLESQ